MESNTGRGSKECCDGDNCSNGGFIISDDSGGNDFASDGGGSKLMQ